MTPSPTELAMVPLDSSSSPRTDRLALLGVLALAVTVAGFAYADYLPVSRQFFTGCGHDRQAHYYIGLRLADDVREGGPLAVLRDLTRGSGVWGPLHGILLAGVLLVGGFDIRLAVLPSLAGFVGTAVFGFLAARRASPSAGNLAGVITAIFVLASPAHRAYGTDIMLESLGGCLSLMVLYFYLVSMQDGGKWAGCGLALALTGLFFHKINYYILIAASLVVAELAGQWRIYWEAGRALCSKLAWFDWLRAELRNPVSYVLAVLLAVTTAIFLWQPAPVSVGGHLVQLYPPYNLLTVVYAIWFVRFVLWWRRVGLAFSRSQDLRIHQLVLWHAWPILVSFLFPSHLKDFFSYLTRHHGGDDARAPSWLGGLPFYGESLMEDYHLSVWLFGIAVALAILAFFAWRSARPGSRLVFFMFLVAGFLTVYHPSHRSRFLLSWIGVFWVMTGIGFVQLLAIPLLSRRKWLAPSLGVGLAGCMALVQLPQALTRGYAPEVYPTPAAGSLLDMTDGYLPSLAQSHRVTIFSSVPLIRFLADSTFMERYGCQRLETHWFGFGPLGEANRTNFANWLQTTKCDTVVYIDRLPGSKSRWDFTLPDYLVQQELGDALRTQSLFAESNSWDFPQCGCRVSVWRKSG